MKQRIASIFLVLLATLGSVPPLLAEQARAPLAPAGVTTAILESKFAEVEDATDIAQAIGG